MKRYLFFLRHLNDIDNIAPAIYFYLQDNVDHRADVILYHEDYDYAQDLNLKFLKTQFPTRFSFNGIEKYFDLNCDRAKNKIDKNLRIKIYNIINYYLPGPLKLRIKALIKVFKKRRYGITLSSIRGNPSPDDDVVAGINKILNEYNFPSLVIFDFVRTRVVIGLLTALRQSGVKKIISLPTSPLMNYNIMRSNFLTDENSASFIGMHDYSGFDAAGLVDRFYETSYHDFFGLLSRRAKLPKHTYKLGAIRYCPEWLDIKKKMGGESFIFGQKEKKNILFLLSHPLSNVNKEEVTITIEILARFSEYNVCIMGHTRDHTEEFQLEYCNIKFVDKFSTSKLIDWSDAILFWSTSAAMEGYMKEKFMVCLSYITSNRNLYSEFDAGYVAKCRDDFLRFLFLFNRKEKIPYNDKGRKHFIHQIILADSLNMTVPKKYLQFMRDFECVERNL